MCPPSMAEIIPFPRLRRHEDVELTKRQLAEHWGVSPRTLELWHQHEGLPSGGRLRLEAPLQPRRGRGVDAEADRERSLRTTLAARAANLMESRRWR